MSRHGFVDLEDLEYDHLAEGRWKARLQAALRGKRGQVFLRDLIEALDAMEAKELHAHNLGGDCVCAMGALARARGVMVADLQEELDDEDGDHGWATEVMGDRLDIAPSLAREVAYRNDECGWQKETPAQRWRRMRRWAEKRLTTPTPAAEAANEEG